MHGSLVFLTAFSTSVLTTLGTAYVVERFDVFAALRGEGELSEVPALKGLTEADARENLKAQRLVPLIKARVPSEEGPPGSVIGQSVPAGQRIPVGHPLSMTVAEALPRVPSLVGLSVAEARARLEPLGFKLSLGDPVGDASVPEGKIVAQSPLPGAGLAKGGPVVVRASSGLGEIEVPKVVGMSVTAAKAELEEAGLKVGPVRWVSIAETATFIVLSQKPESLQKVKPATEVQLTANR